MADINVNPTRSELKRLNARRLTAMRGHKLLKDKRDEMVRRFTEAAKEAFKLRERVERGMEKMYSAFSSAGAVMSEEALCEALALPTEEGELFLKFRNVVNVSVPSYSYFACERMGETLGYGYAFTSGELDMAVLELKALIPLMISLAEKEKCVKVLAGEIEKTRRRVGALEYIMIPRYEAEIKRIAAKLDENERGNTARLMKVKDMMIEKRISDI